MGLRIGEYAITLVDHNQYRWSEEEIWEGVMGKNSIAKILDIYPNGDIALDLGDPEWEESPLVYHSWEVANVPHETIYNFITELDEKVLQHRFYFICDFLCSSFFEIEEK